MNELALFAGSGGGILGGKLLGWRTICAVEIDPHAAGVLSARQNDGCLSPFPIWDDITTFEGQPWRGLVDVVSGGFPCQDISAAGRGAGITGKRSGLWREMARIIGEVRPQFVLVENSPNLTSRGLGCVLGDLATMGFDAWWGVLGACHAGAPHIRERIWILANSSNDWSGWGKQQPQCSEEKRDVADADRDQQHGRGGALQMGRIRSQGKAQKNGQPRRVEWCAEPNVGRVAHGVASRVDRLRCIGNGQVPDVVRLAWETLVKVAMEEVIP